jgi:acetylornithine/N-succinyldiaminopimelate aminotransferase
MSTTAEFTAQDVMPTYGRFDLDIVSGSGCRVVDGQGREMLDFGAGIAVCSLGHAHPEVTDAVARQAGTLVHTSNLYRTAPQAALAHELVGITGAGKVFFCNSGAEANEGLIKLARRWGHPRGKFGIITFEGSFHGRTMACIAATAQAKVKAGFGRLPEGFGHVPFGDLEAVGAALDGTTAAVLIEPVQGEGGIHPAAPGFLEGLRALCDEAGVLLFFDEVQCGLGRTGDLCGWKSIAPGVEPDGVSWAKGIANGFPLGAFWATSRSCGDGGPLCDVLGPGSHGTTYGGNPVACAAGIKVLEVIRRDRLEEAARERGAELADLLRAGGGAPVRAVRAVGLMIGVELDPELPCAAGSTPALEVVRRCMDAGLLVIPAGERVVRFLPPLNVGRDDIREGASIFLSVLQQVAAVAPVHQQTTETP